MPRYKSICYNWSELITNNSKIGPWNRDLLNVQFKYLFFFPLAFQLPSPPCAPILDFHNVQSWFPETLQKGLKDIWTSKVVPQRDLNHFYQEVLKHGGLFQLLNLFWTGTLFLKGNFQKTCLTTKCIQRLGFRITVFDRKPLERKEERTKVLKTARESLWETERKGHFAEVSKRERDREREKEDERLWAIYAF